MKKIDEPHIVRELKIENTIIRIADNYCRDTTPEQVSEILARIARNSQLSFMANSN